MSKEGIIPYLTEIFAIGEQLLKLGEEMSDREILTMVQNVLPKEWRDYSSSIDGREEAMTFQSLGKIEESRLKEGSREENQAFATMSGKKGRFIKFGPQNKKRNVNKARCFGCNNFGHYKRDCPRLRKDKRKKEEAHIKEEPDKKKSKKEEARDLNHD